MYLADLSPRDRAGPALAVLLVHIVLGAMLLTLGGRLAPVAVQQTLKLFNVHDVPPPPPAPPPPPRHHRAQVVHAAGGAAPARKSEASPVVAPPPEIVIPVPQLVVAAITPQLGSAATQGTAPGAGSGQGTGGQGSGAGGGSGNGNGPGDDGNDTHPQPLYSRINPRAFPRELTEFLPRGASVFIIFSVQLDGRATECTVRQSSGDPALDATVCQLAEQRFRYQPARHSDGTPFVAKSGYMQVF